MKTIQTGKATLLVVKVPEGAQEIHITEDGNDLYYYTPDIELETFDPLPPGKYKLLGEVGSITEEGWKEIVRPFLFGYWDCNSSEAKANSSGLSLNTTARYLKTATESGHSLMEANGIVFKNKYGEGPAINWKDENTALDSLQQWQDEESKVGNYVALILEK